MTPDRVALLDEAAQERAPVDIIPVTGASGNSLWSAYRLGAAYDEMFDSAGKIRATCARLYASVNELSIDELRRRQQACEQSFLAPGHHLHGLW